MTKIRMDLDARYRHTSGVTAMVTQLEGMSMTGSTHVELVAMEDPRKYEGQPFEIKQTIERVLVRRDPSGPYTPENATEVEIEGVYYADPIKIPRVKFDAEWTLV